MKNMLPKVLYIDSDAPAGHLNFNQIWLKALGEEAIELTVAFPQKMSARLRLPPSVSRITIPDCWYSASGGALWHLYSIFRLFWLQSNASFAHYNLILFSSFNAFSFYLGSFFYKKKCYLACHNNVQKACEKKSTMFFLRMIAAKHHLIVFEEGTKEYLQQQLHFPEVSVIHHGHNPPIDQSKLDFRDPAWLTTLKRDKKIVFIPSYSSTSLQFLKQITTDGPFNAYLSANSIVIVLRSKFVVENPNFFVISQRLTDDEYASVFIQADIILLAYPADFRYRTSSVLIETLVNDKACVLSDIDAFQPYKAVLSARSFFSDITGLIAALGNSPSTIRYDKEKIKHLFALDFTSLLTADNDSEVN